jgi:alkylation response protein AidB-like acyl-CoA dehydrogenase
MDFEFSEEQKMLATMARHFFSKEYPAATVRDMAADEQGYSPELWKKVAGLGWLGFAFPEKYGGVGGSFLDLAILLEEMGRACFAGPFFSTVLLGGLTILDIGSESQKSTLLPRVANGDIILTMALLETDCRYEAPIETRATKDGKDYIIDGTKIFVENAHVADYILTPAKLRDNGISLFLADARSPGISIEPLHTETGGKQCEVVFNKVKVPEENIIGEAGKGEEYIEAALRRAAIARCAEMIGGAKRVLEMTAEYAKERVQFGHPIGSFQAIQQEFASLAIDVESSTFITYKAAWMLSEGLPCAEDVAVAKAWVSEAYRRVTVRAHQIHGTIAFTEDHDLPLYYRKAKESELSFGDAGFQRNIVAQEFLD